MFYSDLKLLIQSWSLKNRLFKIDKQQDCWKIAENLFSFCWFIWKISSEILFCRLFRWNNFLLHWYLLDQSHSMMILMVGEGKGVQETIIPSLTLILALKWCLSQSKINMCIIDCITSCIPLMLVYTKMNDSEKLLGISTVVWL